MAKADPLFVSHFREKLINSIIFFCTNTKHCHTLKLFKLLHFLDFEHFRQTGRSVTGLHYIAWPQGPAPVELWTELHDPKDDLKESIAIIQVKDDLTNELVRRDIKPKKPLNLSHFSKRERDIMERLSFFFDETRGEDMTEVSHLRDLPWNKVFQGGKGKNKPIPYRLSLESRPIIEDMPSLSSEDYEYTNNLFAEIEQHTE